MNRGEFLKLLGLTTVASLGGNFKGAAQLIQSGEERKIEKKGGLKSQEAIVERPVTAIVIGAGSRGNIYAMYADQYPQSLRIVGVSDLNPQRRAKIGDRHEIAGENRFGDWSEVFAREKFADAVIISTPDNVHYEPCMKALEMGYDVLLEKPIAQTAKECTDIAALANRNGCIVGVCHVLRYAPYFVALKETLDSGAIGDILSLQHLEAIRYHHFAHSFVRGNWHDSRATTPLILAKSCHDLDIIRWLLGRECEEVGAFGQQSFFKADNAPKGSAARCLNCSIEAKCPFSAVKIYIRDRKYLYVFDLPADKSKHEAILREKLATTNYGRCVFRMENDQCDHYTMMMKFDGGVTAGFNMEAMTSYGGRFTRIFGTKGDIVGDMKRFTVTDYLTNKKTEWYEDISELPGYQGHGGGDWGIMRDFVLAVGNRDGSFLSSSIDVSVESHLMGFGAEKSRMKNKIVKI